ncbi:MAG: TetR/AcrR family transcriptional regulator [Succinivibrio sp.]|jgi:AcrR family transcriptional regulator|nr:TetR/AcrR family transcriptional regulator [Succinivibrio sp.]
MSEFRKVTSKELIIKHGIKEFLERGFKSASLRSIVKKAGLTTGAFYNYYSSKEELFNELVDPYERHFINVVEKSCDDAIASAKNDNVLETYEKVTGAASSELFSYVYDHYDNYLLLLSSSDFTEHSNFLNKLVKVVCKKLIAYKRICQKAGLSNDDRTLDIKGLEAIVYSEFKTVFSIVLEEKKKELGVNRMNCAKHFYTSGWKDLFVRCSIESGAV